MRKLILLGEGDFGPALLASLLATAGIDSPEDTFAIEGNDHERIRKAIDSICNTIYRKDSIVVLCDFVNGSAAQEAWLVAEKRNMISRMMMISGANVSALGAALRFRETIEDDKTFASTVVAEAQSSIQAYGV